MKIILGSASKSRRRILERAGFQFQVMTADIDEKSIRFDDPRKLVLALANAKADNILSRFQGEFLLITGDQVVLCNDQVREKPLGEKEAREFLRSYSEYPAEAINGIVIVNTKTGMRIEKLDISKIKFKLIPEEVIDQLIERGNIFSQAGAFSAEDPLLVPFIDYIDGTLDSIEGLPMEIVRPFLSE